MQKCPRDFSQKNERIREWDILSIQIGKSNGWIRSEPIVRSTLSERKLCHLRSCVQLRTTKPFWIPRRRSYLTGGVSQQSNGPRLCVLAEFSEFHQSVWRNWLVWLQELWHPLVCWPPDICLQMGFQDEKLLYDFANFIGFKSGWQTRCTKSLNKRYERTCPSTTLWLRQCQLCAKPCKMYKLQTNKHSLQPQDDSITWGNPQPSCHHPHEEMQWETDWMLCVSRRHHFKKPRLYNTGNCTGLA